MVSPCGMDKYDDHCRDDSWRTGGYLRYRAPEIQLSCHKCNRRYKPNVTGGTKQEVLGDLAAQGWIKHGLPKNSFGDQEQVYYCKQCDYPFTQPKTALWLFASIEEYCKPWMHYCEQCVMAQVRLKEFPYHQPRCPEGNPCIDYLKDLRGWEKRGTLEGSSALFLGKCNPTKYPPESWWRKYWAHFWLIARALGVEEAKGFSYNKCMNEK